MPVLDSRDVADADLDDNRLDKLGVKCIDVERGFIIDGFLALPWYPTQYMSLGAPKCDCLTRVDV